MLIIRVYLNVEGVYTSLSHCLGVTSADWPRILNEVRLKFGNQSYCKEGRTVVIFNNKFLGGITELKLLVSTKYIYYLMYDNEKAIIDEFAKFVKSSGVSPLVIF